MTAVRKLSDPEIRDRLNNLNDWSLDHGKLYREYKFKDFVTAFAFMTKVAQAAEAAAHHPEWFNVYDTVKVHLSTHDVGGISARDFDLAQQIDHIVVTMALPGPDRGS
ncbi:MAG: 4a-hydroxytetrahydrobiopterin dehydratase [Nitrospira sp.]|nr:4a-hydroxytetrahydrobiopterin dehydratase [Nitrospira sp. BO4]